jgi:hypothetical protein
MMGAAMHNLGKGCAEDVGEGRSSKSASGRPPKVGHFHDDVGPTHFTKVIMAPEVGFALNYSHLLSLLWHRS